MKNNYFGHGPYLQFSENGTVLSHGDDVLDCATEQKDQQRVIDICLRADGKWQYGVDHNTEAYVANVIIPARQYKYQIKVDANGNPVLNEEGKEQTEKIAIPLDMEQVSVNLWTLPESTPEEGEEINDNIF